MAFHFLQLPLDNPHHLFSLSLPPSSILLHLYVLVYCSVSLLTFPPFPLFHPYPDLLIFPAHAPLFTSQSFSNSFLSLFLAFWHEHFVHPSIHPSIHYCSSPPIYFHYSHTPYLSIPLCFCGHSSFLPPSLFTPSLPFPTLCLPVFVSLSFQEFIWRKCCFPNLITPLTYSQLFRSQNTSSLYEIHNILHILYMMHVKGIVQHLGKYADSGWFES